MERPRLAPVDPLVRLAGCGADASGWLDYASVERGIAEWTREEDAITGRVATAEAEIRAPRSKVWRALTDPDQIQKYMFGSRVETDWKPGSRITWKGEYEGKKYEDKGEILEVVQERRLKVTHFSPLSGKEDAPENYHTLVYELKEKDGKTHLSLSQDNNPSEQAAEHSRANWGKMLSALKEVVEGQS